MKGVGISAGITPMDEVCDLKMMLLTDALKRTRYPSLRTVVRD